MLRFGYVFLALFYFVGPVSAQEPGDHPGLFKTYSFSLPESNNDSFALIARCIARADVSDDERAAAIVAAMKLAAQSQSEPGTWSGASVPLVIRNPNFPGPTIESRPVHPEQFENIQQHVRRLERQLDEIVQQHSNQSGFVLPSYVRPPSEIHGTSSPFADTTGTETIVDQKRNPANLMQQSGERWADKRFESLPQPAPLLPGIEPRRARKATLENLK